MGRIISMRMIRQDTLVQTFADSYLRTGEPPFIKSILEKYHEAAKATGAIVSASYV